MVLHLEHAAARRVVAALHTAEEEMECTVNLGQP